MSNFICDKCGTECIDSPIGFVTGCDHYPADVQRLPDNMEKVLQDNLWNLYATDDSDQLSNLAMNKEKQCEIERLSTDAHEKTRRYEYLGMMNTPKEPEARKSAAVEYAMARREMIDANHALEDALSA